MGARSEDSLASLLLVNRLTDRPDHPLTTGEYWRLLEAVARPAELLGLEATAIGERAAGSGIDGERIASLFDSATQVAFQLERIEASGFRALTPFDDDYPGRLRDRLGHRAPPVLFAVGPTELLSSTALGIVGSRGVEPEGQEVARRAARLAVDAGLAVVSGGAKGVDQVSMAAAFQAGGAVVGILADALERRVKDPETRRVIAEGRVCLVSPFTPSAPFSVRNAMGRNKLIHALAERTLVVASDAGKGGTWEGAIEALRRDLGPVVVWLGQGAGPGNAEIVERGALGISDLDRLLSEGEATSPRPESADQLRLGL